MNKDENGSAASLDTPTQTDASSIEEAAVSARAAEGDEKALGELYEKYKARIHAYIHRRTGDDALTEDLTTKVFLKMLEAVKVDNPWRISFSGWLFRIAHNMVIDYYRVHRNRERTTISSDALLDFASLDDPEAKAIQATLYDLLRSTIEHLTPEQTEVITLRFLEEYSIAEVAEMLGKTEGSIKALQSRGVEALRLRLAGLGMGEKDFGEDLPIASKINPAAAKITDRFLGS